MTPVADDLVGVAILTSARGTFDSHLDAFPALKRRLCDARPAGTRAWAPAHCASESADAWPAGCCWSAMPPGTSTRSPARGSRSRSVPQRSWCDCVRKDRPEDYEAAWRRVSWECRLLTGSLLWARNRSLLAPRIVPAAALLPGVFADDRQPAGLSN